MSHGHPHGPARTATRTHASGHAGPERARARRRAPARRARRGREPAAPRLVSLGAHRDRHGRRGGRRARSPARSRSLSDAGHMLTDAGALGLALVAAFLATRPADDKRTFGYRRAEVLAAQINVGALARARRSGSPGRPSGGSARAAARSTSASWRSSRAIGLAANLAILWFLHARARAQRALRVPPRALGHGLVGRDPRRRRRDGDAARTSGGSTRSSRSPSRRSSCGAPLRLVLEITDILMEAVPRHLDVAAVTRQMESADGVLAVHDLHIWTISSGLYALSAHLVVHADAIGRNDEILTAVKGGLRRTFGIDHTTLQIESAEYAHVDDVHTH